MNISHLSAHSQQQTSLSVEPPAMCGALLKISFPLLQFQTCEKLFSRSVAYIEYQLILHSKKNS